jgi:hypothetical protein
VTTAESAIASDERCSIEQRIEAQNLQHLLYGSSDAKTCTLSFFVKSSVAGKYGINIRHHDASVNKGLDYTINSADTWERKEISFTGYTSTAIADDNGIGLWIRWMLIVGTDHQNTGVENAWNGNTSYYTTTGMQSTWGTNTSHNFYLTGVQLEIGQNATEFEHEPFANTLRKCQRYYEKSYNQSTTPGTSTHLGSRSTGGNQAANTTGEVAGYFPFTITKRSAPTMTIYDQSGNSGKTTISLYGTGTTANQTSSASNISETVFFVSRSSGGNGTELYVQFEADAEL